MNVCVDVGGTGRQASYRIHLDVGLHCDLALRTCWIFASNGQLTIRLELELDNDDDVIRSQSRGVCVCCWCLCFARLRASVLCFCVSFFLDYGQLPKNPPATNVFPLYWGERAERRKHLASPVRFGRQHIERSVADQSVD